MIRVLIVFAEKDAVSNNFHGRIKLRLFGALSFNSLLLSILKQTKLQNVNP